MSLASKFSNLRKVINQNGGLVGTYLAIYRRDDAKWGELVGEDKFGNKYFHNPYYFIGRSRWIEYSPQYGMDYDASQVPAEWHRWLHCMTDDTPTKVPPIERKWRIDHTENLSGTKDEYVPYSTTRPKIEAWKPPQK